MSKRVLNQLAFHSPARDTAARFAAEPRCNGRISCVGFPPALTKSNTLALRDYFDRIAIIHLPEREDRFKSVSGELRALGVDVADTKVRIPPAERPADANGFPSRGVYGNFLSHTGILRAALNEGLTTVWTLEDDAIFSRCLIRSQEKIVAYLQRTEWDICYFGHSVDLAGERQGFVRLSADTGLLWAHCYAVHRRVLSRLVEYLERAITLPRGHPAGGKLYIDAALTLFRRFNPDVVTLAANPALSVQKGGRSSLAGGRWYDQFSAAQPIVAAARGARDYWWKVTSGDPAAFLADSRSS